MTKKSLVVSLMMFAMVFFMSGCVDLFAVPGVAVSPDGSTVYFLGGVIDMEGGGSTNIGSLVSLPASGGAPTTIMDTTGGGTPSAFAVSPTTGDVAYVVSNETNGTTEVMLYNVAAGSRALVANGSFPSPGIGTMMEFSPDGSKIALSLILAPADILGNDELTPDQLSALDSVLYVIDANSGEVKLVSDQAGQWVHAVDWSPSGSLLAYNAWVDTNGDGSINTSGGFASMMDMSGTGTAVSDLSQVFIYDVNAGSVTQVQSTTLAFGAEFVSDTSLAYLTLDAAMMMFGSGGAINVYDLGSGSSTAVHQSAGMIMGLALSPDGTQVAWTETGASSMESSDSSNTPVYLFASDAAFSSPRQVAEIMNQFGFIDIPVWMPNGQQVLLSATNPVASLVGSLGSMMGGMTEAFGDMSELTGTPIAPETIEEALPQQEILLVDIASGTTTQVFTGVLANSSLYASVLGMVSSGDMEGMFEGLEGQ